MDEDCKTYDICGVIAVRGQTYKLLLPAPLLILDAIAWAYEMVDSHTALAHTAQRHYKVDEEREYRNIVRTLKAWIEDQSNGLEEIPALQLRARVDPIIVVRETLINYLQSILEIGRVARDYEEPEFLFDASWGTENAACFYTNATRVALSNSGTIAAFCVGAEELQKRIIAIRAPWDRWK